MDLKHRNAFKAQGGVTGRCACVKAGGSRRQIPSFSMPGRELVRFEDGDRLGTRLYLAQILGNHGEGMRESRQIKSTDQKMSPCRCNRKRTPRLERCTSNRCSSQSGVTTTSTFQSWRGERVSTSSLGIKIEQRILKFSVGTRAIFKKPKNWRSNQNGDGSSVNVSITGKTSSLITVKLLLVLVRWK